MNNSEYRLRVIWKMKAKEGKGKREANNDRCSV